MAVKIRLKRVGMPKQASYRIVVSDAAKPRDGAVLETLGNYAPYRKEKPLELDMDCYGSWVSKGAQPTDAVKRLVKLLRKRSRGVTDTQPGDTGKSVTTADVSVTPGQAATEEAL